MSELFIGEDTWLGGFYELAIQVGAHDDRRLNAALSSTWSAPDIEGCYERNDVPYAEQVRVEPDAKGLIGHLYGIAALSGRTLLPCGTVPIREEEECGLDWLVFYFPLGGLASAIPEVGGYPFEDNDSRIWRERLDGWLANLARRVFEVVDFKLGLIGFEAGGTAYAENYGTGVPADRAMGILLPSDGGLTYYPTNQW